jgi:exodeoxyribonuclease VII small subunit
MPAKKTAAKAVKERAERSVDDLTFEEAFRELEEIVGQLEGDGLALEESLALYERGQLLAARCGAQLDVAELRVQQLQSGGSLTPLDVSNDRG